MRLQAKLSIWMACVLAVAGAYLAFQGEREQVRESAALIRELKARIAELETAASRQAEIARPAPDASEDPPARSAAAATPASGERPAVQRPARSGEVADPSVRAAAQALWLVRTKAEVRHRYPGIAKELGLTAQQEDALFDLLARQELEQMQRPRMLPTITQDEQRASDAAFAALLNAQNQALEAQLGAENYQRYRAYQGRAPERRQVQMLDERLGRTHALSEDQTSRLVAAMYQERERYLRELPQIRAFDGYSNEYPFVGITMATDPAERALFADEQLIRTKDFLSRLHDRAAAVLTSEQLRRFDEIREEHLAQAVLIMERTRHPPAAD